MVHRQIIRNHQKHIQQQANELVSNSIYSQTSVDQLNSESDDDITMNCNKTNDVSSQS